MKSRERERDSRERERERERESRERHREQRKLPCKNRSFTYSPQKLLRPPATEDLHNSGSQLCRVLFMIPTHLVS